MMDKREPPAERIEPSERELAPDTWKWKRLRNIGFSIQFWPLSWGWGVRTWADFYGGSTTVGIGPIVLEIHYNACDGIFGRAEINVPV